MRGIANDKLLRRRRLCVESMALSLFPCSLILGTPRSSSIRHFAACFINRRRSLTGLSAAGERGERSAGSCCTTTSTSGCLLRRGRLRRRRRMRRCCPTSCTWTCRVPVATRRRSYCQGGRRRGAARVPSSLGGLYEELDEYIYCVARWPSWAQSPR